MKRFELNKTDRKLAILIDPDKHDEDGLMDLVHHVEKLAPDYIFIGGSLIYRSKISEAAKLIRSISDRPMILFPGHFTQLTDHVDAVLLLSLISGRNPDLLIGQHVLAAPKLRRMRAEIISTGYMLIDGGKSTSVSYISHTQPIPRDKEDIALCTAQAGELVGMRLIYMDAGSGAEQAIPVTTVEAVANGIEIPLIVGGGIKSLKQAEAYWNAGANLIVIGNAFEELKTVNERDEFARRSL
ncbi:MAG: geranylgeranylglyceryl/heptaprenylglyceryl phosphate synthase [Flavobacteriales bacterium]|nr:geranylgeranylglyceryl/heptaprenylglyceryl phosphate synthase [Flavobacteriales bacterium]